MDAGRVLRSDRWHGRQVACAMLGALASNMAAQDVDLLLLRRALLLCQDTDSGVRQVAQVRQHIWSVLQIGFEAL